MAGTLIIVLSPLATLIAVILCGGSLLTCYACSALGYIKFEENIEIVEPLKNSSMTNILTSHKMEHFNQVFTNDIYPVYKAHQDTFDPDGIHGVMHIARCIIAAFALAERCPDGKEVDLVAIFYAVAFHDSGRRGNQIDFWEMDSRQNCLDFCTKNGIPNALYIASLIPKSLPKPNDFNYVCVHDADVLDIMRPCAGQGGLGGFKRQFMLLFKDQPGWCDEFILRWCKFVLETEARKKELSGPDCFEKLVEMFN